MNLLSSSATRVIISPGSDANWLGIINNIEIKNQLQRKSRQASLVWVPSLYVQKNETDLIYTLKHLLNQKISPKIYLPD